MPVYARLLDIESEVGELAKEYLKGSSYGTKEFEMTDDFKEEPDMAGFTVCYVSRDVAVMAMRENGKLIPGFANMSLDDYRNYYQNAVDESTDKSVTSRDFGNIPGFIYEAEVDGEVFTYYCFTYKTDKDFWMQQIAVQSKNTGKYEEQIIKWAESAKFD